MLNFPIGDFHGAEMTMKGIPRLDFHRYFLANEIIYAPFRNAFDGSVMAAGAERRVIIVPNELSQIVVPFFGVVEKTGHKRSGRIPATKPCVSAEDDDTEDVSAELGTGNSGAVCENLTTSDHPQVGGGLEGVIGIAIGSLLVFVDERIE